MNVQGAVTKIKRRLQDPTILEDEIVDEINEKLSIVAGQVRLPPLIVFEETVTVADGSSSVEIPDFDHDLLSCRQSDKSYDIDVYANNKSLWEQQDRTETGTEINGAAEQNGLLHVRPIASGDIDLVLSYYKKPSTLTISDDIEIIPKHLHNEIIVSGVLAELLPESSDDLQVKEVRKQYHTQRFISGVRLLENYYRNAPKQVNVQLRYNLDY